MVIFAGQVIEGNWLSLTVTVKLQVTGPELSVQVTVVVPFWNSELEGGLHVTVPHPAAVVGVG